jgi:hypothetical protein
MKLGVLAASTLIAVASFGSVSFAQSGGSSDGGQVMSRSSRTTTTGASDSVARVSVPTQAPTLEGARPAAGMLPAQATGPIRGTTDNASNRPGEGSDMRSSLR